MTNSIKVLVSQIKEKIFSSSEVKEFLKLSNDIRHDKNLMNLVKERQSYRKKCKSVQNRMDFVDKLNELNEKINENPLISNYRSVESDVNEILISFKEIIDL